MKKINVPPDDLKKFTQEVFEALSIAKADAALASEVLSYADAHGISTHGIQNLINVYVPKIKSGEIDPLAICEIIIDEGAIAKIDGKKSLGLVTASQAMQLAINKSEKYGISCVAVSNSTHFGSAGYYSNMALKNNKIGIAMSNLGQQGVVRPFGSRCKLLGSNPLSMGAPVENLPAFNLDMSVTVTSSGKIKKAHQEGRQLSPGLLFNLQGETVTDPAAYLNQEAEIALLGGHPTTGGYKGFGLAMLVDILCGILTGSAVGPNTDNLKNNNAIDLNVGHFFIVINIQHYCQPASFKQDLHTMLNILRAAPMHEGFPSLGYPGFQEAQFAARAGVEGITINEKLWLQLKDLAKELNIASLANVSA